MREIEPTGDQLERRRVAIRELLEAILEELQEDPTLEDAADIHSLTVSGTSDGVTLILQNGGAYVCDPFSWRQIPSWRRPAP